MGRINNTFQATGVTAGIIVVIYKTTAPGAEVARLYRAGPQTTPWNYVFTDIDDGVYIVKIHETPDGSSLGLLRHDYWQDAVTNQVINDPRFFTVGGLDPTDPTDGDTVQTDPSRAGKVIKNLFMEGFRFLKPGVECDLSDPVNITLLGGYQFSGEQKWYYELAEVQVIASPVQTSEYSEIVEHSGNKNLSAGDTGKTWMMTNSVNIQITTLPAITSVADGQGYVIVHDGWPVINVEVAVTGGDLIRFRGNDTSVMFLAKGEMIKVVRKGLKWRVVDSAGQWDRIGERRGVDIQPDNSLIADGSLVDGNVYKRLYAFITSLPPAQQLSLTTWASSADKRGFFAVNTSSKMMRVPDMRGLSFRFLKNIGFPDADRADNVPSGFQPSMVGPHNHPVTIPGRNSGDTYITMNDGSGTGRTITSGNNSGTETRVDNIGLLGIVLI